MRTLGKLVVAATLVVTMHQHRIAITVTVAARDRYFIAWLRRGRTSRIAMWHRDIRSAQPSIATISTLGLTIDCSQAKTTVLPLRVV